MFIDSALPLGQSTTFTPSTGTAPERVSYFRERPEVPASSTWGLLVLLVLSLMAGIVVLRERHTPA